MKFKNIFIFLTLLANIVGCASSVKKDNAAFQDAIFFESYKIFDAQSLADNKKILVLPFKAGKGIEANESLDAVSFMIIRGIYDIFKDGQVKHSVLSASEAQQAELIMRGYITKIKVPKAMGKWFGGEDSYELRVEASLIEKETGETIAVFKHQRESQAESQNLKFLGHFIGQDIGQIIISESKGKGN